jgi:hypothetical protein
MIAFDCSSKLWYAAGLTEGGYWAAACGELVDSEVMESAKAPFTTAA